MPDVIVHSSIHAASQALAASLADRLDLRPAPFPVVKPPDAALAVAPTSEHRHRSAALPVVILSRRVARPSELHGRVILCGARDADDAPAAATAAAFADALGLPLALVHVLSPLPATVPGAGAIPLEQGFTEGEMTRAAEQLERLVAAAGVEYAGADLCVVRGTPGPTLADLARARDAALVVVGASVRSWPSRVLAPSVTSHLGRRCERPVLVCPRHPVPAMRLREALGCRAEHAWWD